MVKIVKPVSEQWGNSFCIFLLIFLCHSSSAQPIQSRRRVASKNPIVIKNPFFFAPCLFPPGIMFQFLSLRRADASKEVFRCLNIVIIFKICQTYICIIYDGHTFYNDCSFWPGKRQKLKAINKHFSAKDFCQFHQGISIDVRKRKMDFEIRNVLFYQIFKNT